MRKYAATLAAQGFISRMNHIAPDRVIVVPLGNYPECDAYRSEREIREELWLQHVANGHRHPQSYIRAKPVAIS